MKSSRKKSSRKTFAELQAWLDHWDENRAVPDAKTLTDFLGIELAPEPPLPVGQRRRSPDGAEVIKTDAWTPNNWWKYRGAPYRVNPGPSWFTDAEVSDWDVIA